MTQKFPHSSHLGVMCRLFFRCEAARALLGGGKLGGSLPLRGDQIKAVRLETPLYSRYNRRKGQGSQARQRLQSRPGMNGVNLKNIAGNEVSIFLFRFELRGRGIDFVLNEEIAADMYPEVDEELKLYVHACCETLLRYRHLSVSNTIMDGNFLKSGEFEVMLSKGLGRHFAEDEKARLFQDAKHIADLLATVMERRTQELKQGKQPLPLPIAHPPDPRKIQQGLKKLGNVKHREAQLQWLAEGRPRRPGLRPLRPADLPPEVTAASGYDHRGHCYLFEHKQLGELGRIVLIPVGEQEMLMQAELYQGQDKPESPTAKKRKAVFEQVVATVNAGFDRNFPRPS
jgi:hypothetical protein